MTNDSSGVAGVFDQVDPPPAGTPVPISVEPRRRWRRLLATFVCLTLLAVWLLAPTHTPYLPWLNAPLEGAVRQIDDQSVLVVRGRPGAPPLYGVRVTIRRARGPSEWFLCDKVVPGYTYVVGGSAGAGGGPVAPSHVGPGDEVRREATGYWKPLVFRFGELPADRPTLTFDWQLVFGTFNDDVVVTNTSPVPLTNVTLTARIEAGGRTWTPTLSCARIGPGASHTWASAVSIPGGRYDRATATLASDQSRAPGR
jgi:hypothetical protein